MKLLSAVLLVSSTSILSATERSQSQGLRANCTEKLSWVPRYKLKQPYTSLLNSAYCPSWLTRHIVTKERQSYYMKVPRGVPLAVVCAVCFNYPTTATLTMYHEQAGTNMTLDQVDIKTHGGRVDHAVSDKSCRVIYALTNALSDAGELRCVIRYGSRVIEETAQYRADYTPLYIHNETLEVESGEVTLSCPSHPEPDSAENPLLHVWFYPLATSPRVAATAARAYETFRLSVSVPLVVACATYHLLQVNTQVMVKQYIVRRIQTHSLQGHALYNHAKPGQRVNRLPIWDKEESYGVNGVEDTEPERSTLTEGVNLVMSMPVVVIISVTAVGVLLIAVFAVIRSCQTPRARAVPIR